MFIEPSVSGKRITGGKSPRLKAALPKTNSWMAGSKQMACENEFCSQGGTESFNQNVLVPVNRIRERWPAPFWYVGFESVVSPYVLQVPTYTLKPPKTARLLPASCSMTALWGLQTGHHENIYTMGSGLSRRHWFP